MISSILNLIRLFKAIKRSWNVPASPLGSLARAMILLSGTIFYRSIEGWSSVDSFYFSVTTASTAGLGDLGSKNRCWKTFHRLVHFRWRWCLHPDVHTAR